MVEDDSKGNVCDRLEQVSCDGEDITQVVKDLKKNRRLVANLKGGGCYAIFY